MKKDTIEKIIAEYESDKSNKGYCTIIMENGEKYGQGPTTKSPLNKFELLDDETLVVEFSANTLYIQIKDISKIFLRSKLF